MILVLITKVDVSYYAVTKSSSQYTAYFYMGTGVSSIGGSSRSCSRYNGASSCKVSAPSITAKSGYTVQGWNTSKTATAASVKVGGSIILSGNKSYYTVTKPVPRTYTATFYPNGSKNSTMTRSCTTSGTSTSCKITTPGISAASGFTVVGWGTSSYSTTKSVSTYTSITLSGNKVYYAVTRGSFTATFKKGSNVSSIGTTSRTCYRYNGASSCNVTTPSITPKSGYAVAGWATYSGATTNASYKPYATIKMYKNATFYTAVYKK